VFLVIFDIIIVEIFIYLEEDVVKKLLLVMLIPVFVISFFSCKPTPKVDDAEDTIKLTTIWDLVGYKYNFKNEKKSGEFVTIVGGPEVKTFYVYGSRHSPTDFWLCKDADGFVLNSAYEYNYYNILSVSPLTYSTKILTYLLDEQTHKIINVEVRTDVDSSMFSLNLETRIKL
jgi:hypothetical protein